MVGLFMYLSKDFISKIIMIANPDINSLYKNHFLCEVMLAWKMRRW